MKKLYILTVFLLTFLWGCYDDKGNYDYDSPLQVEISGMPEKFMVNALEDTLKLSPAVTPENLEYDYFWGVYEKGAQGYAPEIDTIAYTRQLDWQVTLKPGRYSLVFGVKERTTGIFDLKETEFEVGTSLTNGWYILRSQDGITDLDVITEKGRIENVIALNNDGKKLEGNPVSLSFFSRYKAWNPDSKRYGNEPTVFALSEKDAVAIKLSDGSIIREIGGDLFYGVPSTIHPEACYGDETNMVFINDGKVHMLYNMGPNSGRFGAEKGGEYRLSPWRVFCRQSIFYDESNSSFCTTTAMSNGMTYLLDNGPQTSVEYPPVRNMNADLLYMGAFGNNSRSLYAWTLMQNKDTKDYVMYKMDASLRGNRNPIRETYRLDASLGLVHAEQWASNRDLEIIYFLKDGAIYSCDIQAGFSEKQQTAVKFAPGEQVTWMGHLKYTPYNQEELWFDYMTIATFDGSRYKIYFYTLRSGDLDKCEKVLEGIGKVGDLFYIRNMVQVARF